MVEKPDPAKTLESTKVNPSELPEGHPVLDVETLAAMQKFDLPYLDAAVKELMAITNLDLGEALAAKPTMSGDGILHKGNVMLLPHVNEQETVFVCYYLPPGTPTMKGPYRVNVPFAVT